MINIRLAPHYFSIVLCLLFQNAGAQDTTRITISSLNGMKGCWKGTISYLDYSSGKTFSMPAELNVKTSSTANRLVFYNIYPDEPKANLKDTLAITEDGRTINGYSVVSVKRSPKGSVRIIADKKDVDGNDNKPALLRHTYSFSRTTLTIRKDVLFDGTTVWIKRNEFSYTRQPCNK